MKHSRKGCKCDACELERERERERDRKRRQLTPAERKLAGLDKRASA